MWQTLIIAGQVVQYNGVLRRLSVQSIAMYHNKHPLIDISLFRYITQGNKLADSALLQQLLMGNITFDDIYNIESAGI